jgi:hypothetical protein
MIKIQPTVCWSWQSVGQNINSNATEGKPWLQNISIICVWWWQSWGSKAGDNFHIEKPTALSLTWAINCSGSLVFHAFTQLWWKLAQSEGRESWKKLLWNQPVSKLVTTGTGVLCPPRPPGDDDDQWRYSPDRASLYGFHDSFTVRCEVISSTIDLF